MSPISIDSSYSIHQAATSLNQISSPSSISKSNASKSSNVSQRTNSLALPSGCSLTNNTNLVQVLNSPTGLKHLLQKKSSQSSLLNNNITTATAINQHNRLISASSGNVNTIIGNGNEMKFGSNTNNSGSSNSAVASAAVVTSNATAAVLLQLTSSQSNLSQTTSNINTNTPQASNSQIQNDDVEIMKQRSANNNTFLCIKIPDIQMMVSYKANKEKNIKDLNDVSLLFPLFEVHDQTWTWLDLIDAIKSHVKKALVSQAIKHKLIRVPIQPVNKLINRTRRSDSQQHLTNTEIDEHEQMTIVKLFGTKFIEKKSQTPTPLIAMARNSEDRPSFENVDSREISNDIDINESKLPNLNVDKPLMTRENSSLSLNLKRRFFKFGRVKEFSTSNLDNDKNKRKNNAPK